MLNIQQAAQRTDLSSKMIRHYEQLGLLPPVPRTASGYRQFEAPHIEALHFIRRARLLGFSMAQIADLLAMSRNPDRSSRAVKQLAQQHRATVDQRLRELQALRDTLDGMIAACPGDESPDCAILDDLQSEAVRQTPGA